MAVNRFKKLLKIPTMKREELEEEAKNSPIVALEESGLPHLRSDSNEGSPGRKNEQLEVQALTESKKIEIISGINSKIIKA